MADYRLIQSGDEVQRILNTATPVSSLEEESERAQTVEQQLQTNIDSEATDRQQADTTLQQHIDAEQTRAEDAEQQNADDIADINGKIPATASEQNKLVDEQKMNSSIATATATYRGSFNLVTDLHLTVTAIEADITNVGEESYNSWLETSLSENEQDENGNLLSANSLVKIAHMYYLNLAPGETRHYTFFYDKHSFSPDKVYFFYLDYNRNYEFGALFTLPWSCKYFATDPSKSEVVEQLNDTTDDSPVYNMQGIAQRGKQLRPGIYISGGKKVVVR
jgi:hypothetical protein